MKQNGEVTNHCVTGLLQNDKAEREGTMLDHNETRSLCHGKKCVEKGEYVWEMDNVCK